MQRAGQGQRGQLPRSWRPDRNGALLGAAIFLLALTLRVIYVLQSRANPQFFIPLMDGGYHDEWAWQLATGSWEPSGPFFRAPLYPFFLGAIYAVCGHDYLLARLLQAVVGSGSCVLVFLIGSRLFSRASGVLAGVGAAVYWILIYYDNELLIPVLFVFLVLAFFYALISALDMGGSTAAATPRRPDRHTILSAASGALYGLAAIARPNILILLPALAWAFHRAVKRGFPKRAVVTFTLIALVPIAAVTAYNALAGGDLVLIASQGGVNFYIGNNEQSDGCTAIVPGTRGDWWGGRFDTIKIAERSAGRALKDSEVSSYWFRKAIQFIVTHPFQWLSLTARKLALFWSSAEIGNNSSVYHQRAYASIMRHPLPGFGLVGPLGLVGIWLALRRRREVAMLPFLFVALYMAGVIAFFVCARYRVPIIPFLLIFASFAVTEVVAMWRKRERAGLLWIVAGFGLALLAVNVQAMSHRENIAQARFHDGIAWAKAGNVAEAENALRDALRLDPNLAVARTNLANLLSGRGDADEARGAYERAIAADPRNAMTWTNLASLYLEAGHLTAADSIVTRALEIDPDFSDALRVLGVIREEKGDLAGARQAYLRALRFTREPHRLENNLGLVAMKEGDAVAAERHLRRAVELKPSYVLAWNNLAMLLVKADRLAEAVEPLEQAAALQPNSSAAWSNLAEVLKHVG
ncbi:MAG: tetratricopeptide repeat protein, partial [Candidatus Eisenbacteria sp.]|nr:tetratricopeptide repeat protein [Candidatus Eisenbacteria bacterium]